MHGSGLRRGHTSEYSFILNPQKGSKAIDKKLIIYDLLSLFLLMQTFEHAMYDAKS